MTPLISYDGYLNSIELPFGILDQVRRLGATGPLEAHISGGAQTIAVQAEMCLTEESQKISFEQDTPLTSGIFEVFLSTPNGPTDSIYVLVPHTDQTAQISHWQAGIEAQFKADRLATAGDTSATRYYLWKAGELFLQSKAYESAVDSWWELLESIGPLPTAPIEELTSRSPFEHTFALGQLIVHAYRHLGSVSAQQILNLALEVLPTEEGMDVWLIAAVTCRDSSFSSPFLEPPASAWPWLEGRELPSETHEISHAGARAPDIEPSQHFSNTEAHGTSALSDAAAWVNASSDSSVMRLQILVHS